MFLSKPCFPANISKQDLEEIVKENLGKRHWREFNTKKTSMVFQPYYFFSYDAFFEEKNEESGALIVKDTETGSMALNAETGEFDENISSLIEEEAPEMLKSSPVPEDVETEIERASITESDAKKISPMRLAAKLGVGKQNVELSGFQLAFVPFWRIDVEIQEKTFELVVNAVNGEIAPNEEIPYREKSLLELGGETVSELKEPKAWLEYSSRVYHSIVDSGIMRSLGKAVMTNRYVQAAIVIIILIILFWPKPSMP